MSDQIQARKVIELDTEEGQLLRLTDGQRLVQLREFRARIADTPICNGIPVYGKAIIWYWRSRLFNVGRSINPGK